MSDEHRFWRITLDTNPDFCNLNCTMCEDHSPYSESKASRKKRGVLRPNMDKTLLEKVIREAHKMGIREIIPSTMGEPLIYPNFEVFLDLCHELGLKLNLTTNGTFPSPEKHQSVEYWAKRIIPIGSDVKISWNGATAETHNSIMLKASLDQHIENAKRFIAVRDEMAQENYCSVTMQLTFMRSNLEEIPDMVKMAINLGFDRIKGHQLWSHFPELEQQSLRNDIIYAERWNKIVDICNSIANDNGEASPSIKLDNFNKLEVSESKNISLEGECPFLGKEIWVDPGGRFNVCCAPDQERKKLGYFGNLNENSLAEIIHSDSYKDLQNNYLTKKLCQGCNMRRPNE
ncbi:MAG: MoaA/NifB/PqqE/SkfB family radical SAM enzyme [Oleiphilaceae bacterium]|jgi:MoaA/NifB/PqqE/SkfB family radical SAM enzyme